MRADFKPALGPFSATMVVVGGIIGAGIFITPSVVAQRLETVPLFLAAWVAGGAIALIGALAYAELGALFPHAGGQYVYLRETYSPLVAFLYGWAELLLIKGGALAAVAITFGEYLLRATGSPLAGSAAARGYAVAAILLVSAINWFGVTPGSRVLNLFVVLKVAALAVLIAAGLAAAGPAGSSVAAVRAASSPGAAGSLAAFGAALIPVLFAYGGWQSVNWMAEEVRDPRRTVPRALLAGTVLVVLLYVTINVAYLRALGLDGLAASSTPAADAARWRFGAGGESFVAWAIAISTFGFLNLMVLAPTRIYYAMAADRLFFPQVARLHPRWATPHVAIALQAAWAILLALTGSYAQLLSYVVFADWIFFGLTVAALVVLRKRRPEALRPFRAWGSPVLPALFVLAALGVVVSVVRVSPRESAIGAGLIALGVPAYALWRRRAAMPAPGATG